MLKHLKSYLRRGLAYELPLVFLLLAILAHVAIPSIFEHLSYFAFDLYELAAPRPPQDDPPVVIVDIDEKSLKDLGQWPWPRTVLAKLLSKLGDAGAMVVTFDVLFSEPDRTSPEALLALLQDRGVADDDTKRLLKAMADPDSEFAAAISKTPVVVGFNLTTDGGGPSTAVKAGFAVIGGRNADPYRFVNSSAEAVSVLPQLLDAAAGNGFVNEPSDWDNIVRHVPLVLRLGAKPVPSLAAETLRLGCGGARTYLLKYAGAQSEWNFGENSGLNAMELQCGAGADGKPQRLRVPLDKTGAITVYYTKHDANQYISASDIVSGKFDPKRIDGHIVLIGSSAAGLNDLKATPIQPDMPGVEVHAQLIDQVLQQEFVFWPDWGPGIEIIFTLFTGLLLVFAVPRFGALPSAGITAIAIIMVMAASWFAFKNGNALLDPLVIGNGIGHVLLDPIYPIAVVASLYVFSTLLNWRLSERKGREIREAFSRYVSPHYVEELAKDPDKLVLGGEIRMMTIMFCDIRGFTTLSEGLSAHDLGMLINSFLTPMTEIIMDHKGTIDKYIGDCIMAFWNAPLDDPDHARNAVAAAMQMRIKLDELNAGWRAEGRKEIHIGIGINTGECSVGNFGSNQKFNYSLLGDPVNLSSRLEGLTKMYGVDLVIGEDTAACLDDPNLIELDLVAVKGKTKAVRIFTLPPDGITPEQYLARHNALLSAYRHRDWQGALDLLEDPELVKGPAMPGLYGLFRERITQMQIESPPADWDGVFVAHEK
ncbi:MAG: adenylate/guanylate cyclase domain-containing protein [Alphaproteobacteria bacterium]|nr:adenylate/guanylate cyclase domain-containing protein [Alphaproteobacteria bacterium]